MCLLRGNMHMESGDYERAIQSFENARIKLGNRTRQPPLIVSLVYPVLPLCLSFRCVALCSLGSVVKSTHFYSFLVYLYRNNKNIIHQIHPLQQFSLKHTNTTQHSADRSRWNNHAHQNFFKSYAERC